jgi:hypothetical protein
MEGSLRCCVIDGANESAIGSTRSLETSLVHGNACVHGNGISLVSHQLRLRTNQRFVGNGGVANAGNATVSVVVGVMNECNEMERSGQSEMHFANYVVVKPYKFKVEPVVHVMDHINRRHFHRWRFEQILKRSFRLVHSCSPFDVPRIPVSEKFEHVIHRIVSIA